MKLNIITRCTRLNYIRDVMSSIFNQSHNEIDVKWWLVFDIRNLKEIDTQFLKDVSDINCDVSYYIGDEGDFGHQLINKTIDKIDSGWIYVLDDDNLLHENFYQRLVEIIKENPRKRAIVFSQKVDGKDFSGLDIRIGSPGIS